MKSLALSAIVLAALASPVAAQTPPPATTPPVATPPEEPEKPDGEANAEGDDVDTLRQEYLHLRDELYKSRARAAAVSSALYSTKITVKLAYQSGRFYTVDRAVIRLDRASVYDDTAGAIAADDAVRFEGYVAPGRHLLSIRVEATGKDDDRFSSATEASFVVEAVGGKDLVVVARAKDGGDIPYQWKKGEHGSYKLSIEADVKAVANDSGKAAKPKDAPKKKTAIKRHSKKERRRAATR
jgi:hypothetical protein